MTNTKSFLKNSFKYCVPSIISAIIGIAVIPIISRVFPTDQFGKINMFYSVGNMILYIVLLGLDSAYIRFYFEPPEGVNRKQIFSLAIWTSVILDIILCVIAVVFLPQKVGNYLFGEENNPLVILLAIYVLGLVLFRLLNTEARMEKKAGVYNLQQILLIITNRVSYVFAALYTTDYKYAVSAITLSTIIFAFIFLIIQKSFRDFSFPQLPREKMSRLLKFAIPFMPTTLMTWLNNSLAKMILTGYGDFNSVGILTIATSLANVFSIIPSAFCIYWSPFIYSNYKTDQQFIEKVHNYIFVLSICMLLGIFCFQDILYIFVAGDYKISQAYFMLVMLTPIQTLLCETTSYGIVLSYKIKYNLYISIAAVVVNVTIGWTLYHFIGVYGIVAGIASSAVFQFIVKTFFGQKYYNSIVSWKTTLSGGVLMLVITIGNVFVYNNLFLRIIIALIVFSITIKIYREDIKVIPPFIRILLNR